MGVKGGSLACGEVLVRVACGSRCGLVCCALGGGAPGGGAVHVLCIRLCTEIAVRVQCESWTAGIEIMRAVAAAHGCRLASPTTRHSPSTYLGSTVGKTGSYSVCVSSIDATTKHHTFAIPMLRVSCSAARKYARMQTHAASRYDAGSFDYVRNEVPPNHDRTSSEMCNAFMDRLARACTGTSGCQVHTHWTRCGFRTHR